MGDSAKIQDKTTESSACSFLMCLVYSNPGTEPTTSSFQVQYRINSLPNNNITDWSKLKDLQTRNQMMISVYELWLKILWGKEENGGYQHFLLYK